MSLQSHAQFQVATKALLFSDDKILVLSTPDGYIDFPGGRVDESEYDIPWTEALKREMVEELGASVQFNIGKTLFVSKRQYHAEGERMHVAAIFFECQYLGGEIQLSDEHGGYEWLPLAETINHSLKFLSEDERHQLSDLIG